MTSKTLDSKTTENVHDLLAQDPASRLLGISITKLALGECQLSMTVTDTMTNGYGLCHGGFIFTLADTALAFSCATYGHATVTANAQIEFINPAKLNDQLMARASITLQKGRHIYCDIKIVNQENTAIALCRGHQVSIK
ncbi:MAG: hotdog fold thioesterase [Colwellia sp.]|nr:hotdog fold thioesterase [Colwellia sp.]